MIRPADSYQQWSSPEQLWIAFGLAVLLHGLLLGLNGLRTEPAAAKAAPQLAVSALQTKDKPIEALAAAVSREASGNQEALKSLAEGLAETGAGEALQDIPLPVEAEQTPQLAGAQGQNLLLQRQSPMKVYYSRSKSVVLGQANITRLSAAEGRAGDAGQHHITGIEGNKRRLSLGAASKEDVALQYVEGWRRWMSANGNSLYPAQARRLGLRGDVLTQVRLNSDGSVDSVKILRSSGQRLLDQAVLQTTRQARWYLAFPKDLAQQYDQLEFNWRWRYGAAQ